jgi:hypothetical protein
MAQFRLYPARLAPDYGFLFVDHHARAGSLGFIDMAGLGVHHRYLIRLAGLAKVGG